MPLLLDGAFGDFGAYRDLVHGNYRGRPIKIELSVDSPLKATLKLEYKYRTVRRELVLRDAQLYSDKTSALHIKSSSDYSRYIVPRLGAQSIKSAQRAAISNLVQPMNFIPRLAFYPSKSQQTLIDSMTEDFRSLDQTIDHAAFAIRGALTDLDYIGAMRQAPQRTYYQTGTAGTKIGPFGENWPGLFAVDASRAPSERRIVPEVTRWLADAGLAGDVRLNYLSDRHYEFQVQHPSTKEYENLADVGQGNSQIIPVLIGGFQLSRGSTYLIEEPEIHLHPRAQGQFGDFLMQLRHRMVSTIVETHSEYLILRLQQHVAAGRLDPRDIVFYYVSVKAGKKGVRRLRLDAEGRFDKPLDQGFFPERLAESRNLALIRKDRRADNEPRSD